MTTLQTFLKRPRGAKTKTAYYKRCGLEKTVGRRQGAGGRRNRKENYGFLPLLPAPAYSLLPLWSLISEIEGNGIFTISPFAHSIFTLGVVRA
jgi:hypothetical protein